MATETRPTGATTDSDTAVDPVEAPATGTSLSTTEATDSQQLAPAPATGGGSRRRGGDRKGPGPVRAVRDYYRETISELRKVQWPSRGELTSYTIVTVVFVAFMVTLVSLLDYGLTKGVLAVFG